MKEIIPHKPVMVDEVINFLQLKNGYKVLDATVGGGGHAGFILEKIEPDGFLIGIDRDENLLKIAQERLNKFNRIYNLVQGNFRNLDKIFKNLGINEIDAVLFDLGVSSYQIEEPSRGFSFDHDGFLDMRMDRSCGIRAYEIVNKYSKKDLERIIRDFGEERYFRRIVSAILERREKNPIKSTLGLSELIKKAVGKRYSLQRIHPATRTFQALRIAVNEELESLEEALSEVVSFLSSNARLCVISFHSLEDRIVKIKFKEFERKEFGSIVTKKPITPTSEEVKANPRSRSAKLRVFSAKAERREH